MEKVNYTDLLCRFRYNEEQAANDLERYLLRREEPAVGAVARAVVCLRSDLAPVVHAHWESIGPLHGGRMGRCAVCSRCGKITVILEKEEGQEHAPYCCWCHAVMDEKVEKK